MATQKPDLTRVWADTAPSANIEDPDVTSPNKYSEGWGEEVPTHENFNYLQKNFSQGLAHINEQGIAVWDNDTVYPEGGLVKGSDGVIYKAISEQSGSNPVNGLLSNWVKYSNLSPSTTINFNTVEDVVNGVLPTGEVVDFNSLTDSGNTQVVVDTTMHNTISKAGGAKYIVKTLTQAASDSDVIDGFVNFNVVDGVHVLIREKRGSEVLLDWIDTTGVTSESDTISAFLNAGYDVKLPEGVIAGSNITMPTNAKLRGSGAPRYNDTLANAWDATGTLIKFSINVDNCQNFELSDFSVSNDVSDGVSGGGVSLGRGEIKRVNTNTVAHAILFNLLCPDPKGALDPNNKVVGGVYCVDCEHWGGVNGYVSKHHNITFERCVSHGTSSQSFVAISDNINAATTYNRATFTRFIACQSFDSANDFRTYTRDVFSSNASNNDNTNNVESCYMTSFIGCRSDNTAQYPLLLGDFDSTSYASLNSKNILIDDHADSIANFGFIRVERADNVTIRATEFRVGNGLSINTNNCTNVIADDTNTIGASSSGQEVKIRVVNDNSTSFSVSYWTPGQIVRFQNTNPTTINSFNKIVYGRAITFWIDDNNTKLILNGDEYSGNGTRVTALNTIGVWRVLSVSSDYGESVQYLNFSANMDFSFDARKSKNLATLMTGNSLSISNSISNVPDGTNLSLQFDSNGGARIFSSWEGNFIFNGATPSSLGSGNSLLVLFSKRGNSLIEISRVEYVTT